MKKRCDVTRYRSLAAVVAVIIVIAICGRLNAPVIMYKAVEDGNLPLVRVLLSVFPKLLNARAPVGDLPELEERIGRNQMLSVAIQARQKSMALYLISKGADVNDRGYYGCTPLHFAAEWGDTEVIRTLIRHGADANLRDSGGRQPLQEALDSGNKDAVQLLREVANCRH